MCEHPYPVTPETLVDILCWRAEQQPERRAYTFLRDGETDEICLTYAQLDQQARAIAVHLRYLSDPGECALLLYPSGLEYIAAFFGCLYAGIIAVPLYPPRPHRPDPRIEAIATNAQAALILTTTPHLDSVQRWLTHSGMHPRDNPDILLLTTDTLPPCIADEWFRPALQRDTLAFLQYTSGSTAAPKGVMVTHSNLLHNSALIWRELGHTPDSVAVSWLPMFHDFGLIGKIVQALYGGFPCILMSPTAFTQRPLRWLHAISHYRATTSYAPNFAYDLCVRAITPQQRNELDLSTWRVAVNASEPVRSDTLRRFANTFGECGFCAAAFSPAYGLAEATLCVTVRQQGNAPVFAQVHAAALEQHRVVPSAAGHATTRTLVGCGQVAPEQRVVIADPHNHTHCRPGHIGEIWLSGPCIASGYWQHSEATSHTFGAYLADSGDGPFLRTGDLGFIEDGELFITGRLKDLIIIDGRNHYPQDIELTVQGCHVALRPGRCAAFSVDMADEERLVVVAEVARDYPPARHQEQRNGTNGTIASRSRAREDASIAIEHAIRHAVAETYDLDVYDIVLLKPHTIPMTSSGKLQRHACRRAYLDDTLQVWQKRTIATIRTMLRTVAPDQCSRILETYLHEQLTVALRIDPAHLDKQQPLIRLGLDSLMATQIRNRAELDLGLTIPLVTLLEGASIAQLTIQLLEQLTINEMLDSVLQQRPGHTPGDDEEEDVLSL